MHRFIRQLSDYKDQAVIIKGWVFNARSSGKIAFLQVRDGTGFARLGD